MKYDPRGLFASFNRLAPRERLLLSLAVLSVVVISLYSFVWEPVQSSRDLIARRFATTHGCTLVLKGARTVVARRARARLKAGSPSRRVAGTASA
jgi:type II secretory pathway component PulM